MRRGEARARIPVYRIVAASAAAGLGIFLLLADLALFIFYRPSVEVLILGLVLSIAGSVTSLIAVAELSSEASEHSRRSSSSLKRIASSSGLVGNRAIDSMIRRLARERPETSRGAVLTLIPAALMAAELAYLVLLPGLLGSLGLVLFFLGSLVAPIVLLISQIYFSDELGRWLERHSTLETDLVAALFKETDLEDLRGLASSRRGSSPLDTLFSLLTLGLYTPVPLISTAFRIAGHMRAHEDLEDSLQALRSEGPGEGGPEGSRAGA